MAFSSSRKILESPIGQAEGEVISYEIDASKWGSTSPTTPTCFIYVDGEDKSATHLSGSASVDGTIITTQAVGALKRDKRYRFVVKWVDDTNTLSTFCEIIGERP